MRVVLFVRCLFSLVHYDILGPFTIVEFDLGVKHCFIHSCRRGYAARDYLLHLLFRFQGARSPPRLQPRERRPSTVVRHTLYASCTATASTPSGRCCWCSEAGVPGGHRDCLACTSATWQSLPCMLRWVCCGSSLRPLGPCSA